MNKVHDPTPPPNYLSHTHTQNQNTFVTGYEGGGQLF